MKLGLGITTTPERSDIFISNLKEWIKYLPPNTNLYVHNDTKHKGVPYSKNKCLSALDDCDHIFLVDDDVRPLKDEWWMPYTSSKEPHLMYIFTGFGNQTRGIKEIYRSDEIVAYNHMRGCLLYIERRVLDVVGGMDEDFGLGMYEHSDWSNRIHNAGLTTWKVMDVPNSNELIYSMDENEEVESTFDQSQRIKMIRKNKPLKVIKSNSKQYMEYK